MRFLIKTFHATTPFEPQLFDREQHVYIMYTQTLNVIRSNIYISIHRGCFIGSKGMNISRERSKNDNVQVSRRKITTVNSFVYYLMYGECQ